MKKLIICSLLFFALLSCQDDKNDSVFDKPADERVAEAIANLKDDLTEPTEGWKLKYTPMDGFGSYYVFLKFEDDRKVNIRTDLGAEDGTYFDQTLTYRIDNSHGLELIFENYSFFSFLFELDQATFEAEFEFLYNNKTPSGDLVFSSKSDTSLPFTTLVFEEAENGEAEDFLGIEVAENLNVMANDLDNFASAMKLVYEDKDIELYLTMDELKRTIRINRAVRKSNTLITQELDFESPYIIQADSLVLDQALSGSFVGSSIMLKSIQFTTLTESELTTICTDPITLHSYEGITSVDDEVALESTLFDLNGRSFVTTSDFYVSPLQNIFNNGESAAAQIAEDVNGALAMQLYYNYSGEFYGIGFVIQNSNGSITFALREFAPVLTGNNVVFNFAPDITFFGEPPTDPDIVEDNINIYLEALTEGDDTYVFELDEGLYEFFNPCTGWSFVFYDANQ